MTMSNSNERFPCEYSYKHNRVPVIHSTGNDSYSTMSSKSGNQFKVSEITNPDGSVTTRNLHINEHGIWTKREMLQRPVLSNNLRTKLVTHNSGQVATEGLPAMKRLGSFESNSSSSSSEYDYLTEAKAHRLRRQRLARSSNIVEAPTNTSAWSQSPRHAQHEEQKLDPSSYPTRTSPVRQSRMMNTMMYSPSNISSRSSRKQTSSQNSRASPKHVAFSEPLMSAQFYQEKLRSASTDIVDGRKRDFYDNKKKRDALIEDIYSDIYPMEDFSVNQSFSNGNSDAESSIFDNVERKAFVDDDTEKHIPNLYSVTAYKASKADKIGVYVHVQNFPQGNRLVISKITPDGKFANSIIREGDIVVSINGEDMTEDPNLKEALGIVTSATDSVTFVVQKDFDGNDGQSTTQTSISSLTKDLSLLPKNQVRIHGVENLDDSSQCTIKKGIMTDGSMLISRDSEILEPTFIKMNESWKVSGVIVVSVENSLSTLEKPGLRMGSRETASGRLLYITEISTSSAFAKTALRVGDVIITINGTNLCHNNDVADAYSALRRPGERTTIVAKKGEGSLDCFLQADGRQQHLSNEKNVYGGRGSINTALTSQTSGTNLSREPTRYLKNVKSYDTSRDRMRITSKEQKEQPSVYFESLSKRDVNRNNIIDVGDEESKKFDASDDTSTLERDEDNRKTTEINSSSSSKREEHDYDSLASCLKIPAEGKDARKKSSTKRQKVLVTVTKEYQKQNIGIEFALLNNKLVVNEINPRGLLRNAPLVFGDTILSINGISFQDDPILKEAFDLVKNTPRKVTLEILKTKIIYHKEDSGVGTKSCIPTTLFCSQRRRTDQVYTSRKL